MMQRLGLSRRCFFHVHIGFMQQIGIWRYVFVGNGFIRFETLGNIRSSTNGTVFRLPSARRLTVLTDHFSFNELR